MNVTYQKCDNCQAANTTGDPNWVRLLGVYKGSPTVVSSPSGSALAAGTVRAVPVDLCTDCLTKLNVLDLVTLTTAAAKTTTTPATAAKTPAKT